MNKGTSIQGYNLNDLDPKKYIIIKGARVNNLKNLDVAIPRNKFIVITGLSGSGKSSLAFDTLFAEGQRMYVESLSSYARQFLGRMEKPEVDYIKGVSPAIAIEQKVNTRNPRSTVGTTTEIYDYLKLLFARIGITYSPISGKQVKSDTVTDIVDFILSLDEGTRFQILSPLELNQKKLKQSFTILLSQGFTRCIINDQMINIEDLLEREEKELKGAEIFLLIDRSEAVQNDEDAQFRWADSVQTALFEGHGQCVIDIPGGKRRFFSDKFELDGIQFEIPSVNLFSFNNPYGACKKCEGFGKILGIDEEKVMPDKSLSVFEGAILPWRGETMKKWKEKLISVSGEFDFPIHRPVRDLTQEEYDLLWTGNKYFQGLNDFFKYLESKTHKIQYRVMLSRYRGRKICPDCRGTRIRKDASYVKIGGKSITDLSLMPVDKLLEFFNNLKLKPFESKVADRLVKEIKFRLEYLDKVGLGYLNINRMTSTLSGGEYQRIKLATSLGSALVGSMYILDEPSIGLHPRDTQRLVNVMLSLKDLGNSVIVVEHEEEVIRAADQILDIGPDAGAHGGNLVFQGAIDDIDLDTATYTAKYLLGVESIPVAAKRRKWSDSIRILGARENNLKNIDAEFPLGVLTVVTGVSGSGKSTLIRNILYPTVGKMLGTVAEIAGSYDRIEGEYNRITRIEMVDQNPIGKSSRSNPVTYVKAYDLIRQLFASQSLSQKRGYKPAHFSFNVDGGRCETCQGEGIVKIEMQFMADINLTCETCKGARFKKEILDVKYQGKNISEVLDLTIEESLDFFSEKSSLITRLQPLFDVGLGYIRLGQSSSSLSGGEAQRVKLASFLGKGEAKASDNILFIFDEPTTGLHFHDTKKLLDAMNALVDQGHTLIVIEHNMEVIKNADWIIDLGPEGGEDGGNIVFQGTPEEMVKHPEGETAKFLSAKINEVNLNKN